MIPTAKQAALAMRDEQIVDLLDKLSRFRALSNDETDLMERTLHRLGPKREVWRWTKNEDKLIRMMLARRRRRGGSKPYQVENDARLLAEKLGRSYLAVLRRMSRLSATANRRNGAVQLFKREAPEATAMMAVPCQTVPSAM